MGPVIPGNYTIYVKVYPFEGEVDVEDNICELNFTVMPDYHAPLIGTLAQNPPADNVQPFQNVTVWVNVTDHESGVKNVTLSYSVDDYSWVNVSMTLNSTTWLYEAVIPGHSAGTLVKYKIIAYDNAGNFRIEDNNAAYYTYTVIPELPSSIILLLALILSTLSIIILKSKQRAKEQKDYKPET
ncbi:MAG: hypothetical protein N3E47_04930 [Candidatus Bathyarchaeota archaeon]|nr:hypothetical protein [Candidatus Bathyarchaeota archaeon]